MNEMKNLVCVVCPTGCRIDVCIEDGCISRIEGNKCKRGAEYVLAECTNPLRTLTSIVRVVDGKQPVAPVKSDKPVPKAFIFECMKEINKCRPHAPLKIGDIIIENILDTGANIVATCNIR
jgi:Uncharacterized protein with conserved CXXC pairs